jgi:proteasome lid subunit RPN8/RPN11
MESKYPKSPCSSRHSLPLLSQPTPISDHGEDKAATFRPHFQGTIVRNEPAYRPRPSSMPGYHKYSNDTYDAFVARTALEAIAERTILAVPNEMIGYLVGRPFRDAKGAYAVITEAIFAESAHCGQARAETTFDDERRLIATLLSEHPLAERLGWLHSHPFDMPRYSPTDLENQRFWSEPYQVGLLACLDGAGGVSVLAFRGPESEAISPPYMAPCPHSDKVPEFRPLRKIEHQDTALKAGAPVNPVRERRPSLAWLTLAVGVVWPLAFLLGVWMIVQAMRDGHERAAVPRSVVSEKQLP